MKIELSDAATMMVISIANWTNQKPEDIASEAVVRGLQVGMARTIVNAPSSLPKSNGVAPASSRAKASKKKKASAKPPTTETKIKKTRKPRTTISPEDRKAIIAQAEDYEVADVAKSWNITESTVRNIVRKAKSEAS